MVTEQQARQAFEKAKEFFKGGIKSGNKRYGDDALEKLTQQLGSKGKAQERIQKRNTKQLQASADAGIVVKGKTPLAVGKLVANTTDSKEGNCGIMACVAMYFASLEHVGADEMWCAAVYNEDTKYASIWTSSYMTLGHSFALLGPKNTEQWVVDPWGDVYCRRNEYSQRLTDQLNKWQQQGKRISVSWRTECTRHEKDRAKQGNFDKWMEANDPAILSLLKEGLDWKGPRGNQPFE
jgi:hypothetical protein